MHTASKRGMWSLWLAASLFSAAPLLAQNTSSIVCSPTTAAPGTQVSCALALNLQNSSPADAASIGITVTPGAGAPALTGALSLTDNTGQGFASKTTSGTNGVSAAWGPGLSPQLTGNSPLGTVKFTIPATAVGLQTYTVSYNNGQPQAQCCGLGGSSVSPALSQGAAQVVTVLGVLTIVSPATGATLPPATVGAAYSQTLTTSGGTTPFTWTGSNLPGGLGLAAVSGNEVINGTPSVAGTFSNVGVTVKDTSNPQQTATATYSLTVNAALVLSPATGTALTTGTVSQAYSSQTLSVTGGTGPFTWTITSGNTPAGLNLVPAASPSLTAVVSGTPTAAANVTLAIKVTDANGATATANYPIVINGPLTISTVGSTLPTGTVNVGYPGTLQNSTITASGGSAPYTWSLATGSNPLPAGLAITTVNGGGLVSGTPTTANAPGGVSVNIQVKDNAGATVANPYTIVINPQLQLNNPPASLPNGTTGAPYPSSPITFAATGGSGTYTWSIAGLPGVTIGSSSGVLSGTPTTAGTYNSVVVTATDTNFTFVTASKTYSNVVIAAGVSITSPAAGALPGATLNTAYTTAISASGGTAPYVWSISAGALPAGLGISGTGLTGTISGTPMATGANSFTVKVQDSTGSASSVAYTLAVNALPTITGPASLPIGTVNAAYTSTTIQLSGGSAPIAWTQVGLPAGLAIGAATGVISGTPTTNVGSPFVVTVTAKDANGATVNQLYTGATALQINPALVITNPQSLPIGIPSVAYTSTTFTASGGSGAGYTWSQTGLPAGLTFSAGGVLAGTPTVSGAFTPAISVTDGIGVKTTKTFNLVIAPPLSISGPATLPGATVNVPYVPTTVTATGGSGTYTNWSATGLPTGLSISSTSGTISGTPTVNAGSPYAVQVTVTDSNGTKATANFTLAVGALPLKITTGLLPSGVINLPYPYTSINATGGVGNYSWTVTGLPPGLTTDGNGDITGTPTTTTGSPFSVKVTLTDSSLTSVTTTFSLTISGTLQVGSPATLPAAALNTTYAPTTVLAGGGLAPYTYTATGLPTGLTISQATGVISGTPTTAAGSPYSVVVTTEDSTGHFASKTYTLVVNAPLTITGPASLPAGMVNSAYTSTTITATGGSGSYTWSATGLPGGLSIAAATGAISGTPTTNVGSPFSVVVTVTDSSGNSAKQTYTVTINGAPSTLPVITGVNNAPGGQTTVAPNTYVALYGTNFAAAGFSDDWTHSIVGGNLPTKLDNVSVTFGGQPVYVSYVSSGQINVLLGNVGSGPVQVVVTTAAGSSAGVNVQVQQYSPAFFSVPGGNGQPVATHLDGTLALGPGTISGLNTVPAAPGETIVLWGTGFGPTTPAYPLGVSIPSTSTFVTTSNVTASINNAPAAVYQSVAALATGFAGLYQMGITVPSGLANGSYTLTATVNGVTTPVATLVVHN